MKKFLITLVLLVLVGTAALYIIGISGTTKKELDTIDFAKKKSAETASLAYVEYVEYTIMLSKFDEEIITVGEGDTYIVKDGLLIRESGIGPDEIEVKNKGYDPSNGSIIVFGKEEKVESATLTFKQIYDGTVTYPIE